MDAVKNEVKDGHVYIAYVLFGLSFLQLVRLLAGWCVNRGQRQQHDNAHAQSWLYDDDDGERHRTVEGGERAHPLPPIPIQLISSNPCLQLLQQPSRSLWAADASHLSLLSRFLCVCTVAARVHDDLREKYADRAAREADARRRGADNQESLLPGGGASRTTASRFQRDTQTQVRVLVCADCASCVRMRARSSCSCLAG